MDEGRGTRETLWYLGVLLSMVVSSGFHIWRNSVVTRASHGMSPFLTPHQASLRLVSIWLPSGRSERFLVFTWRPERFAAASGCHKDCWSVSQQYLAATWTVGAFPGLHLETGSGGTVRSSTRLLPGIPDPSVLLTFVVSAFHLERFKLLTTSGVPPASLERFHSSTRCTIWMAGASCLSDQLSRGT